MLEVILKRFDKPDKKWSVDEGKPAGSKCCDVEHVLQRPVQGCVVD
jgi:hypothetical protein